MNKNKMPLVEALIDYSKKNPIRLHMPGHKGGAGVENNFRTLLENNVFAWDVTEIGGLDDWHSANGVINEAQVLAAALMGANYGRFLPNGTSSGIIAAILTYCNPGDTIILPANAHRSVNSGLILSGAKPVYVKTAIDQTFAIPVPPTFADYQKVIDANPQAKAVFVINPDFHGLCTDIQQLAEYCHQKKMVLIADEAHGSHFVFSDQFPVSGNAAGADVVIQSWHKTLGSLTQSSMIFTKENNPILNQYLSFLTSTSPSYLLMASLDATRFDWQENGKQLAADLIELGLYLRQAIAGIHGWLVLDYPNSDPSRIVLANQWGINGYQMAELFRAKGLEPEMAEERAVTFIVTHGDNQDIGQQIVAICREIAINKGVRDFVTDNLILPDRIGKLTPQAAFKHPQTAVELANSVNCVCGELVTPYPPGIPVVAPGELITAEIITVLQRVIAMGGRIHMNDQEYKKIDILVD